MPAIEIDRERARSFIEQTRLEFAHAEAANDKQTEKLVESLASGDSDPQSWRTMSDKAADFVATRGCPAWEVDAGEREMWSAALAETLDRYFPGALEGFDNWHPIAKLIGSSCVIAAMRIDFEHGGFAPLHEQKGDKDGEGKPAGWTLDIDQRQDAERENHGSYKTSGE